MKSYITLELEEIEINTPSSTRTVQLVSGDSFFDLCDCLQVHGAAILCHATQELGRFNLVVLVQNKGPCRA